MKKLILLFLIIFGINGAQAQTATNFIGNDCNGMSHDFFAECDSGNVIVLCWVMPCGTCVSGALTCHNVCQSYPNNVLFYLSDDYANTNCASLSSWASSNNITNATLFSNASINMMDYGSTGMPKAVVIGGPNHTVFYNANNTVNPTALQDAINSALAVTGIKEQNTNANLLSVYPSPASDNATIKFNLKKSSDLTIDIFNLEGKLLQNVFKGNLLDGENSIAVNLDSYSSGMYLVKLTEGEKSQYVNLVVSH